MQWVRSKLNDRIEVHVGMHHEFYSEVMKMSSSGDPLQRGGPKQGSLAGVQMSKKIVKNEMLVQCNEWEAKWMIWLKYM